MVALAWLGGAGCGSHPRAEVPAPPESSEAAPDFSLPSLNGGQARLSDFRGKIVLLDFWATWCGPCVDEVPSLKQVQAKYQSRGFTIVGVSVDDAGRKTVENFVRENKVPYPILLAGSLDGVPPGYEIHGLPTAYLIDPQGSIRQEYVGFKDPDELEKDIEILLKHSPGGA